MNKLRAVSGILFSFVFFTLFICMIYGAREVFLASVSETVAGQVKTVTNQAQNPVTENISLFVPNVQIDSESAISVENNLSGADKVIFDKDSDKKLPIASLTKLMTAAIVLEHYDLSKKIIVDELADLQDPMKQDVKLGDTMPASSFLSIMLVESSNKSAYTLAQVLGEQNFVDLMNNKAVEIGMKNTFFADPTGLSAENISTASDLAKLAEYILKNYPKIAEISRTKELDVPGFGQVENTNELLGQVPEIVCGKTGFTTLAKGCLLLVINSPKDNGYLINVILGAEDRFAQMKKLINYSSAICN